MAAASLPEPGDAVQISRYLLDALGTIRHHALFSAAVDWDEVCAEARETAARAGSYADTHQLLRRVLKQAGGRHSHLIPPRPVPGGPGPPAGNPELPEGLITGAAGVLSLPRLSRRANLSRDFITTGERVIRELAGARPRGWVVDLRDNTGGDMWPMLAAVAGLLDPGVLGYFDRPGVRRPWLRNRRSVSLGAGHMARCRARRVRGRGVPVAVLTSARTASAGEAVLVALRSRPPVRTFGAATAGFTTGNATHLLPDGASLAISTSYYADAAGQVIDGPVQPDELIEADADPMAAALAWVSAQ
jgi:carboxyl-terminal processing protease